MSRRQSVICPESQHYYLSALSSPSSRLRKAKNTQGFNGYPSQEYYSAEEQLNCSNFSSFSTDNGATFEADSAYAVAFAGYQDGLPTEWPSQQSNDSVVSMCEQVMQLSAPASLSIDLVGDFQNHSMSVEAREVDPVYISDVQSGLFEDPSSTQIFIPPSTLVDRHASPSPLGPAFKYAGKYDSDGEFVDHEISNAQVGNQKRRANAHRKMSDSSFDDSDLSSRVSYKRSPAKVGKGGKKPSRKDIVFIAPGLGAKRHPCEQCTLRFARPEHLSRHKRSLHAERKECFPCEVPDCVEKDKVTHKTIRARGDNLAPHYQNTHFRWGNSEKSGKNRRISLKESYELGLTQWDGRWDRFLGGRISIDVHDKNHPCEWKMLGYSIKETQKTTVKSLFPNWEGAEETVFKALDSRWIKMFDGTMDYDTAMATGNDILTRPELGLLGVTMMETEEMGISHIDPRWQRLRSGCMSIEDSEILGVKHLNPAWTAVQEKRRR